MFVIFLLLHIFFVIELETLLYYYCYIIIYYINIRAVKRLIASKIKVCVYIIYVGALCIIILYI